MALRDLRKATTEDLLRDLVDRVRRIEHRTSLTIGSGTQAYVLEVNAAGQLTARHATTNTVTVIALP